MRGELKSVVLIPLVTGILLVSSVLGQTRIDLAGTWQVRLDPRGEYSPTSATANDLTPKPVQLPGALRDSGLGEPVGPETSWIGDVRRGLLTQPKYAKYQTPANFKTPFWLQPERHYVGVAYYERKVQIPASWHSQRVFLSGPRSGSTASPAAQTIRFPHRMSTT